MIEFTPTGFYFLSSPLRASFLFIESTTALLLEVV